jgi:hypothetical protein
MKIEKKIWPENFKAVKNGSKKYELRLADFRCKPGDVLVLREWNPKTKKYTGKSLKKKVARIMKTKDLKYWTKKEIEKYGFQIISFK